MLSLGTVCLVLAFPLAAGLAILGGQLGRAIALRGAESVSRAGKAVRVAPVLVLTEPRLPTPSYEVMSVVDIAAPPATVWRYVVTFPDLPPPTEAVFRIGVAAPLRAPIDGTGVGAIGIATSRREFVEPIRAWEEGRLLALLGFQVMSSSRKRRGKGKVTGRGRLRQHTLAGVRSSRFVSRHRERQPD